MATTRGIDALPTILHSANEQLRASAIVRMTTLREEINAAVRTADEAYRMKEQEYLEKVAAWKQSATSQERAAGAIDVGRLQRELATLEEHRQSAKYPHRFLQLKELARVVINPDTRDERKIPHPVFVERTMTTTAAERTIQL